MRWKLIALGCVGLVGLLIFDPFPRTSAKLSAHQDSSTLTLTWEGSIDAPMAKSIRTAVRRADPHLDRIVFVIDSGGGSVAEGAKTMALLKRLSSKHHLVTYVAPGSTCASMCVPVFMAGETRAAAADAAFMFHDAYSVDSVTGLAVDDGLAFSAALNANVFRRFIEKSLASPDFVQRLRTEVDREGEVWRTGRQLLRSQSNIVTQISNTPPSGALQQPE